MQIPHRPIFRATPSPKAAPAEILQAQGSSLRSSQRDDYDETMHKDLM